MCACKIDTRSGIGEVEKYDRDEEHADRSGEKHDFRVEMPVEYTDGRIDKERCEISESEKYPHQEYALEFKHKKEDESEVKTHPHEKSEEIVEIEIPPAQRSKLARRGDDDRILSQIGRWRRHRAFVKKNENT